MVEEILKLISKEEEILRLISKIEDFFLKSLISLLVFLIGWFLAGSLSKGVGKFLEKTKITLALKKIGVQPALEKIHPHLSPAKFFGALAKWFFIVLVLMIVAEILGLNQFGRFLGDKIVPIFFNVFVASLIFIAAAFLSDLAQRLLIGTFEKEKIVFSKFLGKGISIAIWVLATLAILYQLGIASTLILIVFIGVVAFIVLSAGIALGFGAKDLAAKFFKDLEEKLK